MVSIVNFSGHFRFYRDCKPSDVRPVYILTSKNRLATGRQRWKIANWRTKNVKLNLYCSRTNHCVRYVIFKYFFEHQSNESLFIIVILESLLPIHERLLLVCIDSVLHHLLNFFSPAHHRHSTSNVFGFNSGIKSYNIRTRTMNFQSYKNYEN